ncbi:MAG: type II toxin-antitoxin system VapC family toxin [Methylobacter sp.]|nr:type II toxin-antitoxin system VapC family toxin [Methylobacter sp.]
MNGNKYLLDTNFILGILKSDPLVLAQASARQLHVGECSYSAITRMELLGFHRITREEESLIRQKLNRLTYLPLTGTIENVVIDLRQTRKIKLPDAIIAATALCFDIELLTLDQHLLSVVNSSSKLK